MNWRILAGKIELKENANERIDGKGERSTKAADNFARGIQRF
jgi:hypothetical protein